MTKLLCAKIQSSKSIKPLLASRLIPLNKDPGLRPIGIREVLRRIIGKIVSKVVKEDYYECGFSSSMRWTRSRK